MPELNPAIASKCERPVSLPSSVLTAAKVEQLWAADRANLVKCGARHQSVTDTYRALARDLERSGG